MNKKASPITITAVGQRGEFVRFTYQRDCDKRPSAPLGTMLKDIRARLNGERENEMTGPASRAYASWLKQFDQVGLEAMLNVAVRSA